MFPMRIVSEDGSANELSPAGESELLCYSIKRT